MKEIFENRQKGAEFTFLRKVDIFGVPIQINFNQESKHTTKFGGIVSITIFGLLFAFLLNMLIKIANKSDPQVIVEEIIVDNPARFDLTDENFTFALTLLDENYTPFIDETYYTIKANFLYKIDETQPDGKIGQTLKFQEVELVRCLESSFQVKGTQDYFLNQLYNNLFCIKDVRQLYLVGQFEKDRFSVIEFYVELCRGANCKSPSEIQKKLSSSQLQVYFSNRIVKISNINDPFQPIGQSMFWQTNLNQAQVINLTYMNTYINDDIGLIQTQMKKTQNLLFSDSRTMQSSTADQFFYKVSIFMEKNREKQYTRKFLKLTEAVSQVGGIYNVLFFLGCLLAQPFSYLELERKIVNSTFSFSSHYLNKDKDDKKKKEKKEKKEEKDKKKDKEQEKNNESKTKKNDNTKIQPLNQNLNETFSNRDYVVEDKDKKGGNTDRPVLNKQNGASAEENNDQKSNAIKTALTEFKIRSVEYFTYYLRCFKCFKSDIQVILRFGTSKIFEFTDICYIVNKLIEFEKLKHLLLNEQQLKLFEYVPKPKITKSIIDSFKLAEENDKVMKKAIRSKTTFQLNTIENRVQRKSTSQLNILTIMNRSQLDKAREAQKAFNVIYKQQKKLSKIDKKLFMLLDENHIPLFNTNSFDSSILGKYHSSLQMNYPSTEGIHPPPQESNNRENDYFEQFSHKKSLYFAEQTKEKDIIDEIEENSKSNGNENNNKMNDITSSPIQNEESMLPISAIEDIIMSSHSCVFKLPKQLSVSGASPALQYNEEDLQLHLRDISQNTTSKYQYEEKTSYQD